LPHVANGARVEQRCSRLFALLIENIQFLKVIRKEV